MLEEAPLPIMVGDAGEGEDEGEISRVVQSNAHWHVVGGWAQRG